MISVGCSERYSLDCANVPSLMLRYLKPSNTNFEFGSDFVTETLQVTSIGVDWEYTRNLSGLLQSGLIGGDVYDNAYYLEQYHLTTFPTTNYRNQGLRLTLSFK